MSLCQQCGICCDGTIFKRVNVGPGEDLGALVALGTTVEPPSTAGKPPSFGLPCLAFDGSCRVYEERPRSCRDYRCKLLESVESGRTTPDAALAIVAETKRLRAAAAPRFGGVHNLHELTPLVDAARSTDPVASLAGMALLVHLRKHYVREKKPKAGEESGPL